MKESLSTSANYLAAHRGSRRKRLALPAEAVRCMLPVGHRVKIKILVRLECRELKKRTRRDTPNPRSG